jgi:hypothetical protein
MQRKISHRRAERSANIPLEVGCSPRLAGEARPGFRRGRNRRKQKTPPTGPAAGCAPAGSLVASGARRGEQPTEPNHPTTKPQADSAPPSFPEPGPPEAPLTLTFRLCPTTDQHQEPTPRHTQTDARVEDDQREDEQASVSERGLVRGPGRATYSVDGRARDAAARVAVSWPSRTERTRPNAAQRKLIMVVACVFVAWCGGATVVGCRIVLWSP